MTHTLHLGDCREVLTTMDDCSIDAIVCDPPYELGFMGKAWDASGIAYDVTVWRQCLRVLKPGGHLIAFGGSRTYHRLAVAIEDAGFEIRDQIQWIYGSGFPKSLDVSKAMDKQAGAVRDVVGTWKPTGTAAIKIKGGGHGNAGVKGEVVEVRTSINITAPSTDLAKQWHGWGTALKPAHEPAVLARKPLCGTVADNVTAWGVGALNIDGTRVATDDAQYTEGNGNDTPKRFGEIYGYATYEHFHTRAHPHTSGRWPSNVILDEEAALLLGEPSRFFYVAKASKAEREAGLDGVEVRNNMQVNAPRENEDEKHATQRANHHPTVKPLSLMRYLVRLVTPKGGKVLDPFMGSGSTGCAAVREGFDFVGIDLTPEYVAIAQKRIDWHAVTSPLDGNVIIEPEENKA
jgi:site-specific DNA-methyltransferase (adenine-specific)